MTDVSQVCVLTIPASDWEPARRALRMLRELHRQAGGTSRLVRKREQVTLTVTGPHAAVLEAIRNAHKVQQMINLVHIRQVNSMLDQLATRRSRRRAEFAEQLDQAIRNAQRRRSTHDDRSEP